MNLSTAYKLLNLSNTASDDEIKKAYRELVIKHHPDKEGGSETKMKEINSAHDTIQDARKNPHKYASPKSPFSNINNDDFGGFVDLNDIFGAGFPFNPFQNQGQNASEPSSKVLNHPPVQINLTISFKDSVLGIEKEVSYAKATKCGSCKGKGVERTHNSCNSCDGFGRIDSRNGNLMFSRVCDKCYGKNIKAKNCSKCSSKGFINSQTNVKVSIPSGTANNSILKLKGGGHFNGFHFMTEIHTDVLIKIIVEEQDGLKLQGADVISHLNIPLVDALRGFEKDVPTIHGNQTINIPKLSKNKDEIKIKDAGVKRLNGIQRVILNIEYPENVEDLVKFLNGDK